MSEESSNLKTVSVITTMGEARFRSLTRIEAKRWVNLSLTDEKMEAYEGMARACVVSPDKEVFAQWIEEAPMLVIPCATAIQKLSGVHGAEVEKK